MTAEPGSGFEVPLAALGQLLAERGFRYELLAVGGGALQLLGLITRPTRDIDVIGFVEDDRLIPVAALPEPLEQAIADTAVVLRLPADWFNAGPRALADLGLPDGILKRTHRREWDGLVLHIADRRDQIFFKLYAAVDQGPRSKHFDDLRRLEPTVDELRAATAWVRSHDPSEGFREELRRALQDLGVADGGL